MLTTLLLETERPELGPSWRKRYRVLDDLIGQAANAKIWLCLFSDGAVAHAWCSPSELQAKLTSYRGEPLKALLRAEWHLRSPLDEYRRLQAVTNDAIKETEKFRFRMLQSGITNV